MIAKVTPHFRDIAVCITVLILDAVPWTTVEVLMGVMEELRIAHVANCVQWKRTRDTAPDGLHRFGDDGIRRHGEIDGG